MPIAIVGWGSLALLAACTGDVASPDPSDVGRVTITPPTLSLRPGESRQLQATPRDSAGSSLAASQLFWSTERASVATVSDDGVVTAVGPGSTRIAASIGGTSGFATVQVVAPTAASVSVSPTSATLDPGETAQLTARPMDSRGSALSGRPTTWRSSAAGVATVSASGLVSAVAPGSATITVTVDGRTASASVTVRRPPVDRIEVTPGAILLSRGATATLNAVVYDARGNALGGRKIDWKADDGRVASINGQGVVRAKKSGATIVTATCEGKTARVAVTVF
jgi:uncharacterized protein YjdB